EYIDGTLLCKPETELVTAQLDGIELFHKQNSATERNHKPNHHQRNHQFDVFRPVGFGIFFIFERHTNVLRRPFLSLYWSVVNQTEGRGVLDVGRWQFDQAGKAEAKQRDWQRLKPPGGQLQQGARRLTDNARTHPAESGNGDGRCRLRPAAPPRESW